MQKRPPYFCKEGRIKIFFKLKLVIHLAELIRRSPWLGLWWWRNWSGCKFTNSAYVSFLSFRKKKKCIKNKTTLTCSRMMSLMCCTIRSIATIFIVVIEMNFLGLTKCTHTLILTTTWDDNVSVAFCLYFTISFLLFLGGRGGQK